MYSAKLKIFLQIYRSSEQKSLFRCIASASPGFLLGPRLNNSLNRGPEAEDADEQAHDEQNDIRDKVADLLGAVEPVAPLHPKPEDAGKTVGEPAGEERADKAEQVVEDGDGLGDDHGDGPREEGNGEPRDGGELGAADHVLRVAEDSVEDVLRAYVAVDDAGNNNCCHRMLAFIPLWKESRDRGKGRRTRNGNAPDDLPHNSRSGS